MPEAHLIIYFLFISLQVFTGVLANGLIVSVNCAGWIKQRKVASLDLLLSCLAISRIFLQLYVFRCQLSFLWLSDVFFENVIVLFFTNELSLWFATWLGVFYCAKIVIIPHPLFFWLKGRISSLVPWLILGSLLYTVAAYSIFSKHVMEVSRRLFEAWFSKNTTHSEEIDNVVLSFFILGLSLPSCIFLVAVLLLIVSLGRHAQKMRAVTAGTRGPSGHAHLSAMLSILSFVALYFSHYLLVMLLFYQVFPLGSIIFLFCTLMVGTYPSLHSIILILGNPKLKQSVNTSLLRCNCCH